MQPFLLNNLFSENTNSVSKNEESKDHCKADSEQGVLFFRNNISPA